MAPYEDLLFIVAVLGFGSFAIWLIARFVSERARERDRRGRIVEAQIEKFAEAGEFIAFARSEAGLAWLRADSGSSQVRRVLLVLALAGSVSLTLGGALFVNAARLAGVVDPDSAMMRADAAWWGTVLVGLGIGLLAAFVLMTRLGRSWDLIPSSRSHGSESAGE